MSAMLFIYLSRVMAGSLISACLFATLPCIGMNESCVEPGQCASKFVMTILESQITCTLVVYTFLWFTEINSFSHWALVVNTVKCIDYFWETIDCWKLRYKVGLFSHTVRKLDVSTSHVNNAIQNSKHYCAQGRLWYPRPVHHIDPRVLL